MPLNSSEFPKIDKFGIIFDAIPREIDDLTVSSCQPTQSSNAKQSSNQCIIKNTTFKEDGGCQGFSLVRFFPETHAYQRDMLEMS